MSGRIGLARNPFRSLPPEVAVLTAVAFSVALGFGIVAPAIPLFAKDFGVSNFAAGAVVSVFALVRFASAPVAGRLVDRLGERLVLATGIGIVGVSSLLAGLSVAVAGVIGFVGLAAPHFVRAMGVKDPYRLIAPSTLTGAIIVLIADALVRLIPATGELRLGVVTSLVGAPLFALLAWRSARSWMQD